MKVHSYLRFLGVIELIGVGASLIWWLVDTIGAAYATRGWSLGLSFLVLALLIVFGPGLGVLFLTAANYAEERSERIDRKYPDSKGEPISDAEVQRRLAALKSEDEEIKNTSGYRYWEENNKTSDFEEGQQVLFKKNVQVSDTDTRIIHSGTKGYVARVTGAYLIVVCDLNGEEVSTKQLSPLFEKIK